MSRPAAGGFAPVSRPAVGGRETAADPDTFACQACGACCAYSAEWPRFSTEDDADIARIPAAYVDDPAGRMRCDGDRCTALAGRVGEAVSCRVYAVRPEVCRTCEPGDPECLIARRHHGLPV